MKYEFHVGDYVETKDGQIGYISACIPMSVGDYYTLFSFCVKGKRLKEIHAGEIIDLPKHFNRIGQYDFTDCDVGDIKPLLIEKTVSMYCGDGKTNSPSDYRRVARQDEFNDKVIKKINELVEAVNQLEEKVNEMAQG